MTGAAIRRHLFIIAPNNSGSTLLREALAEAPGCCGLPFEAQHVPGFTGPSTRGTRTRLIWASRREWIELFRDASAYDWPAIRRAWHAQAHPAGAATLVLSSPPFLLIVEALRSHFPDARFLFLVRDPHAAIAGIARRAEQQPLEPDEDIYEVAARHMLACLRVQRANIAAHGDVGIAISYEQMCADPAGVAAAIAALLPEIGPIDLAAPRGVKGEPPAPLTDRNAEAIATLPADGIARIDAVFGAEREPLSAFGYGLKSDA